MARIPIQTARRSLDPGSPVQYPSSLPTGAALSQFGDTVARAGETIGNRQEEYARRLFQIQDENAGFAAESGRAQLLVEAEAAHADIGTKMPASFEGYTTKVREDFRQRKNKLLSTIPERLRPEWTARLDQTEASILMQAAETERDNRGKWFRTNIGQAADKAQEQAFNYPDQLADAKAEVDAMISASGLSEPEKAELRRQTSINLGKAKFRRRNQEDPAGAYRTLGVAPRVPPGLNMTASEFENGQAIADFYRQKNLSPVAAAAIAGHFIQENGGRFTGRPGDSGTAFGAAQWRNDRFAALQRFAADRGTTWEDPTTQLEFVIEEGERGDTGARRAWAELQNATTIEDATEAMMHFERPQGYQPHSPRGGHGWENRLRNAREILGGGRQPAGGKDIPLSAASHVKIDGVDDVVLERWRTVQNQFGRQLTLTSGYRDKVYNKRVGGADKSQHVHGNAIDVSTAGMSKEEVVHLISLSSAMGFTGIGVYDNSIHLDTGARRSWGPSYKAESIPAWARGVLDAHNAGQVEGGTAGPIASRDYTLDPDYADIPFADRFAMAQEAEQDATARIKAASAQSKAQLDAYVSGLEVDALPGNLTEDQIMMDPLISDEQRAPLIRTVRSVTDDITAADRAFADYQSGAMRNLNPLDSDERATADKAYGAMLKSMGGAASELVEQQTETFVRETGIIPQRVQAEIRAGFYAKDPALLAAAAGQAVAIQKAAPLAFETMPNGDQVLRDLTTFRTLVDGRGYSTDEAAREILDQRSDAYQTSKKVWEGEAKKAAAEIDASTVTASFGTWVPGSAPGIGADNRTQNLLVTQFREIFEEEFIEANGSADVATEQALRILKRTWGVSSVSGSGQLMQFPPELKYPPLDGSHDYLRDDAMAVAREFVGEGVEIENISVTPVFDSQKRNLTAADWRDGRPPRYQVLVDTKVDGVPVFEVVPGTWAMLPDQIKQTAEARRAQLREGLEANESMGIRDFMMQGEEAPEPVVPRGLANPGRAGRYGNYSVPLPAPPPANFTDPATLLPGVGNVGPVGAFLDPNSREGIAARVSERGRALRGAR